MPLFVAFIAILLTAGFVFGIDTLSGGAVRGYARQGGAVLYAAAAGAASFATQSGALASKHSLQEENRELREAIAMRDEQTARFGALMDENATLREMASLATRDEGVTVPVLSSFESSPYGTFRIGGGTMSGITEGSIVLTPGGFVLGVVTYATARTATVEAFFAPGKSIEMNAKGVPFLAEGHGGGNARAEVPRDTKLSVGDAVLVPAFESRPAGIIGEIRSASSSASASIYIRLPLNLDSIRYVYVLPLQ